MPVPLSGLSDRVRTGCHIRMGTRDEVTFFHERGIATYVRWVEDERARLAAGATLPARLWDALFDVLEALAVGTRFNQSYAATVRQLQLARRMAWDETLNEADAGRW